ncbi:MAG: hypothetical protein H6632_09590 [Anaerolineales bacterium]|nr:hypothetical protein [Anaerolineales bacterium]
MEELPKEEDRQYHTVGGFMMSQFHTVPTGGPYFEWHDLRFEVVDMSRFRNP